MTHFIRTAWHTQLRYWLDSFQNRSPTEGDLVYLHVHSTNGTNDRGQAVVDIFKVEKGKIVEHWDVIQDVPEQAANENTMF